MRARAGAAGKQNRGLDYSSRSPKGRGSASDDKMSPFPTFSRLPVVAAVIAALCLAAGLACAPVARADDEPLQEKPLSQISDSSIGILGQKALQIHENDWKHAETAHFVYHYFDSFIANPVAVEAEFYYRMISKELDKDTTQWERKCHIYIFEQDEDWHQFQKVGGLEPWSGGIHSQGQLFIQRNPQRKFKGNSLAHEVTHLVVHRFYGEGIPLWLDEGFAEYAASRWYASFYRMRGYNARPRSASVAPDSYLTVNALTSLVSYPQQDNEVLTFYAESERLVRFLSVADKQGFLQFLDAMGRGNRFDTALEKGFGSKFFNVEALNEQFKPYAVKDYVESSN